MEIVGGNQAVRRRVTAPGVQIWIDSRPFDSDAGGGDVHFVSTCGAGYVTRLALADVAGHGASVDALAVSLRKLMRKYINTLDQTRFARALNRGLARVADSDRFATAVLLTYFAPSGHLIVCNAGHGRPVWFSARRRTWQFLDLESAGDCPSLTNSKVRYHFERLANLPLGMLEPIDYRQFAIEFNVGDVVLLCTDAIAESTDSAGQQLGEAGLLELISPLRWNGLADLGQQVLGAVDAHRASPIAADDQTLILVERCTTLPPRPSLVRTMNTLAKMIGVKPV
jgi:phosphoserine phosphatase RsbU/P